MMQNKKTIKSALGVLFAVFVLFLTGCTSQTQEIPQAVKNLQKFATATVEHPNNPAPSFKLTDDKGRTFTNDDLKGKVYILQAYTYGCTSCAEEVATLNRIYSKYKDKGVEIISMDIVSGDIETALDTKKKYNGGDWHWALDNDNVAVKFELKSLESTYIIGKDGIIRYKDEAISDANILSKEIEKLI